MVNFVIMNNANVRHRPSRLKTFAMYIFVAVVCWLCLYLYIYESGSDPSLSNSVYTDDQNPAHGPTKKNEQTINIKASPWSSSLVYNHDKQCSAGGGGDMFDYLVIKGMYSTGTNALNCYLKENCVKHKYHHEYNPILHSIDNKHDISQPNTLAEIQRTFDAKQLLLFIIKDPLTWIHSMCRHPYDISFVNDQNEVVLAEDTPVGLSTAQQKLCFSHLFETGYITKKYGDGLNDTRRWNSIIDYYNEWYLTPFKLDLIINQNSTNEHQQQHLHKSFDFQYNFVMIRFEDLLFETYDLVQQLCNCIGGEMKSRNRNEFFANDACKTGVKEEGNAREDALKLYDISSRYQGYTTNKQLQLIKNTVQPLLLDTFNYSLLLLNIV